MKTGLLPTCRAADGRVSFPRSLSGWLPRIDPLICKLFNWPNKSGDFGSGNHIGQRLSLKKRKNCLVWSSRREHFSANNDDQYNSVEQLRVPLTNADKVDFFVATDAKRNSPKQLMLSPTISRPSIPFHLQAYKRKSHPIFGDYRLTFGDAYMTGWCEQCSRQKNCQNCLLTYGKVGEEAAFWLNWERQTILISARHANLEEIYKNYELTCPCRPVSFGSLDGGDWFWLDHRFWGSYGNQTFVTEGKNGYLIRLHSRSSVDQITAFAGENHPAIRDDSVCHHLMRRRLFWPAE